jgi:hypothetical protein
MAYGLSSRLLHGVVVGLLLEQVWMGPALSSVQASAGGGDVVGPRACRPCHASATIAWERSPHSRSRDTLTTPEARRIQEKLGVKVTPDDDVACATCHSTKRAEGASARIVAGVSCESCHGAAGGWLTLHADFGPGRTNATETAEHRDERLGASMAAGMLRPENLYRVAQNCFQCHTVPDQALVETGGHRAGSDIELVAWSQGVIRHNFGPDGRNVEASLERRRQLYVLGAMLDLELSLRGLAAATTDGPYAQALIGRARRALDRLGTIGDLTRIAEVQAVVRSGRGVRLEVGNGKALREVAESVSTLAQDFGDTPGRPELAAIDALLPPSEQYKGTPVQPQANPVVLKPAV